MVLNNQQQKELEGKLKRKERREKAKSLLKKVGIGLSEEEKQVLRDKELIKLKHKIEVAKEKTLLAREKSEVAKLKAEARELNPKGDSFFSGIGFDASGQGGKEKGK